MSVLKHVRTSTDTPSGPKISHLSEALSFRISRLAAINERNGARYFRDQKGVSLSEWRILGLVAEGAPVTTSSIRKRLLMDRGLLSRVVKTLCARGLLFSAPDPADKRHTLLTLTDAGRALHESCIDFTNERNASMTGALSVEEEAEFSRLLDILIEHNMEHLTLEGLNDD